jgi:hypothetical protein
MTTEQLGADWVAEQRKRGAAGARQIEKARVEGRLNTLLGIESHTPKNDDAWTEEDVRKLYAERRYHEIEAARKAGKLSHLLNGE